MKKKLYPKEHQTTLKQKSQWIQKLKYLKKLIFSLLYLIPVKYEIKFSSIRMGTLVAILLITNVKERKATFVQ